MVDQSNAAVFPGGGQPPEQPVIPDASGQSAGQGTAQPQFVTLEQAQKLAKDAADEAFKRAQSLYSKGQAGFEKKIQADLKNLEKALELQKKAGVVVTPEQENHLRQQVINQAFMADDQPPQQPSPEQTPAQADAGEEPPDPVTASAWQMMEQAGVDILEEDPEFKQYVNTNTEDAYVFLKSIEAAIAAKKQRLATQPQAQPQVRTPTNVGAGGGPPPITNDPRNLDALWAEAKAQGRI
jgi:hypothetical protein